MKKLCVVIANYNEASNVPKVIAEIQDLNLISNFEFKIILIDDNSSDQTWKVIKNEIFQNSMINIEGIHLQVNRGKNFAQYEGMRKAMDQDFVVLMDGDGEHSPNDLEKLLSVSIGANMPCIGERKDYARGFVVTAGLKILRIILGILGIPFNGRHSEFVVIPKAHLNSLIQNQWLGIIPILPLLYDTGEYRTHEITIREPYEKDRKTRWTFEAYVTKGLLYILNSIWRIYPKLAIVIFAFISFSFVYGSYVGYVAIVGNELLGVGSVILILTIFLSIFGMLLLFILGLEMLRFKMKSKTIDDSFFTKNEII
jgi:glycosyltransferase involved in cell wall biosynthesis